MSFDGTELAGVEFEVDLENPEFEDVEIDKYNFIRIMEPDQHGVPSLEDFGSGFEIREDGIYLKLPTDREWASLTKAERAVLAEHPRGRPDKPVLAFPFTLRELKVYLDWAASVGHDVPINEDALHEVMEAQKTQPMFDASNPAMTANQSDAALGAYMRERYRSFAERNQEHREARSNEKQRWRDTGADIQRGRQRPASKRQLAKLVKQRLGLPDSEDLIRKELAKPNLDGG